MWLKCRDREVERGRSVLRWKGGQWESMYCRAGVPRAIQLINKSWYYHLLTIWHVCLYYSALLSCFLPTWLFHSTLASPLFLHLSYTFPVMEEQGKQSGRLMCSKDWSFFLAPLLLSFAYTGSICQAVIGLAQSTLLEPPHRQSPWSPCSPDMSRGWWISPSWID